MQAIYVAPRIENFCWRIEQALIREGGFAMIHGDPGTGKSVALRLLAQRLARLPDITVGALSHPQSSLVDFYRELGDIFAVPLKPHNRWGGFKTLREVWYAHMQTTRRRVGRLVAALEVSGRRLGIGVGEDAAVEVDLASGVLTGVTASDSLLVDVGSMQREGPVRRHVRARLIRQGEQVSLRKRLTAELPPPPVKPTGPVQVVQIVDPGQNRQLALWRVFMGARRPGSGRWEIRFDGWELTAWLDGKGEVIFDVSPALNAR